MAEIIGTNPNGETLDGTPQADFILALDGPDTLNGDAGDDLLLGSGGNDTLNGGDGIDLLFGGDGADTLNGDAGGDFLFGEAGNDSLHGGAGDDLLDGGLNNDMLFGDAGDDSLMGDAGNDTLVGGAGNDTLNGGLGADVFKFSFTLTQGGGGDTFYFTDFFAAHGGGVVDGEVADGTGQGQFSSLYTQWLEMLVRDHGLGTAVLDLGQNSGIDGTPVIENMTGEFGERESFTWSSGPAKKPVVHERWYSDSWTSDGGGQDSVSSGDGFDTIVNFVWGTDKLEFSGVTQQQFLDFFDVDFSQDRNGDGLVDTFITINGFDDWTLTLSNFSGQDLQAFAADSIFS